MPLQWTVSRPTRLVIAVAKDELRLKDIENYLDEILAAGALPYRKIFDTTGATLKLVTDDTTLVTSQATWVSLVDVGYPTTTPQPPQG